MYVFFPLCTEVVAGAESSLSNKNTNNCEWVTATTVKGHLPSTSAPLPRAPICGPQWAGVCVCECGKDNLIQFLFLLPKDVPEFVRVSLDCFAMGMCWEILGRQAGTQPFSIISYVRCLDFCRNSWWENISLVIEVHNLKNISVLGGKWSKGQRERDPWSPGLIN